MPPSSRPVTELRIGGTTYRVQSSADEGELNRLAAMVDARISQLPDLQRHDSRSLVLVALALAHDLELEQRAHESLRAQVASRLLDLVGRIDEALDYRDEHGNPLPPVPHSDDAARDGNSPETNTAVASEHMAPPDPSAEMSGEPSPAVRRGASRLPRSANATSDSTPTPRTR